MIFIQLFYTFCKIGIFNFGGGYAMLALIQHEVVEQHAWMTVQEFTDIVALSQMTPGPIGINVATYAGYTATVNAGYSMWIGSLSAIMCSFSVILLPFLLILLISHYLNKHKENPIIQTIFSLLRLSIVGVIAAAACLLATANTFGDPIQNLTQFIISCAIAVSVFIASYRFKQSPIMLILLSGIVGIIVYGMVL